MFSQKKEQMIFFFYLVHHRKPNFRNPEYFVCLLFEYFFQIKVLNQYQNTLKNANITHYIKKKKKNALQHLKLGKLSEIQDL